MCEDFKVFDPIIKTIPINMVNNFIISKLSPKVLFHSMAMFADSFSINL